MNSPNLVEVNHRILIIDANRAAHDDLRSVLPAEEELEQGLPHQEAPLGTVPFSAMAFEIDSADHGEDGLAMVRRALSDNRPYALAFVDVGVPPAWDGVETLSLLQHADPHLQTVLCTASSDFSWKDIQRRLVRSDSLLVLKKPFDNIEVIQLAHALTGKWLLSHQAEARVADLDSMVSQRTAELQLANSRIQQELEERAKAQEELQAARIAAEEASKAKSEFLANMSHEIRTPINGILGFTQLALGTKLTEDQRDYLDTVENSTKSLLKVINEILDFSKIEAGRMEFEVAPFSLRKCVEEAARTLSAAARQNGLDLQCDVASENADDVLGDAMRLRQVLLNLIGNAIKFTPRRCDPRAGPGRIAVEPGLRRAFQCSGLRNRCPRR